jgi:hypothetical protein
MPLADFGTGDCLVFSFALALVFCFALVGVFFGFAAFVAISSPFLILLP